MRTTDNSEIIFKDFLSRSGNLQLLERNIMDQKNWRMENLTGVLKYEGASMESYVTMGFTWSNSPEGHGYWANVEGDWIQYVYDHCK